MDYEIWDFVDREDQLTDLWKVAHQERMLPIVFVAGEEGMGKTYLLEEFRQECQRQQVAQASVDFNEKGLGDEYFSVILKVVSQLGQPRLENVLRAIERIRQTGLKKLAEAGSAAEGGEADETPAGAPAEAGGSAGAPAGAPAGGETTAAAPGVTIHNEATLEIGNIAKGANVNINPIFNALYTDDPLVKDWAKAELTAVFLKELADFTAGQRLVLLFDHWEAASTDAVRWVNENLVDWVLAQPPPQVVLYLASPEFPKIEKARGRAWAARLTEFTQEVARQFWVERWKLPEEYFASAWENSGGEPRLLFWAARRRKREQDNQAGGVYTG